MVDYSSFYKNLYSPLVRSIGTIDPKTIVAIIGFDCGGPLNFCTIGAENSTGLITYISCELALNKSQKPNSSGRYEFLTTCNDERWARRILTEMGRMSCRGAFDDNHTVDFGPLVEPDDVIQGAIMKVECKTVIDEKVYGIIRCIGITRPELSYALKNGRKELISLLERTEFYPATITNRESVV